MSLAPAPITPEMVPLPRAPAVFGLSRSALYRLAAQGRIRMVKFCSRTLVDAQSVRAFISTLPEVKPIDAPPSRPSTSAGGPDGDLPTLRERGEAALDATSAVRGSEGLTGSAAV
jgi:hypothetical protein